MEFLTERHITDLSDIIRINVLQYLDRWYLFMQDDYPVILQYFNGSRERLDEEITIELSELTEQLDLIIQQSRLRSSQLTTFVMWDLVEYLDDIYQELVLIPSIWKFLRSAKTNFNYTNSFEFSHHMVTRETIEDVSSDLLGGANYQNNWQDIAIRNNLLEEDYNNDGGQKLILTLPLNSVNLVSINSIVDSPQGLKVLGLDIQKEIEIIDNDLVVLSYEETYRQSAGILFLVMKGEIPEFRFMGRDVLVGKNVKSFGTTAIARQLQQTFATDDSMTNLQLLELTLKGSDVFLRAQVQSRLNTVASEQLQI